MLGIGTPVDRDVEAVTAAAKWDFHCRADRSHAGKRGERRHQFIDRATARGVTDVRTAQHVDDGDPFCFDAGIERVQLGHAAHEERRAGRDEHRQGNFGDDESTLQPSAAHLNTTGAGADQRAPQIAAPKRECRHESNQ